MPSILSKVNQNTCHALHAWTSSCAEANLELLIAVFTRSLRIYGPFALVQSLVDRRETKLAQIVKESLRGSSFIAMLVFFSSSLLCLSSKLTDSTGFSGKLSLFVSILVGTSMALPMESQSRINAVTILFLKASSEALYKSLKSRQVRQQLLNSIEDRKQLAILLYSASLAVSLMMIKEDGYQKDPLSRALRTIMGTGEASRAKSDSSGDQDYEENQERPEECLRLCRHSGSCASYAMLGGIRAFVVGYMWLITLNNYKRPFKLLNYIFRGGGRQIVNAVNLNPVQRPFSRAVSKFGANIVFDSKAIKFGLFLSSMATSYKLIMCVMRTQLKRDDGNCALAAGAISGLISGQVFPSNQVALYLFWKTIFNYYYKQFTDSVKSSRKQLNSVKLRRNLFVNCLFCLSSTTVLMFYLFRPDMLPRSYVRAVDQIVPRRLFGQLNRNY